MRYKTETAEVLFARIITVLLKRVSSDYLSRVQTVIKPLEPECPNQMSYTVTTSRLI